MSVAAPANLTLATPHDRAATWTLWGATPESVHDRAWGLRQIQVVRPAGTPPDPRGPRQFLLLEAGRLLDFPVKAALDRLYWTKARACRLRVVERSGQGYAESVDCDGHGRLVRIRRDYASAASTTARCWLTNDLRLARTWHEAGDRPHAWAWLRDHVDPQRVISSRVDGRLGLADSPERSMTWLEGLPRSALDLEHAFEGVYQFQPGVWVHESADVGPETRFAGPALVGAGVDLRDVPVVIGPVILADDTPTPAPQAFDWHELDTPTHHLLPRPRLRRGWARRATKRGFDIAASALALACAAPLFPVVMLLIWAEDGRPFFFAHVRQTRGGHEFPCYKFRTMIKNADGLKEQLAKANVSDGAHFFIKNDPRLLRVGKWLRRFQIDEIPQFWNILVGHMSVVGPRPSPDKENQYCPAWREARLSVRPGLTGLWQVRRTREPQTDFQEWIRYDLEYVQRESWRLDIWIILETIRTVVLGGRASQRSSEPNAPDHEPPADQPRMPPEGRP